MFYHLVSGGPVQEGVNLFQGDAGRLAFFFFNLGQKFIDGALQAGALSVISIPALFVLPQPLDS